MAVFGENIKFPRELVRGGERRRRGFGCENRTMWERGGDFRFNFFFFFFFQRVKRSRMVLENDCLFFLDKGFNNNR